MDKYPDINDPDFQFLIARKLEFRNLSNVDGLYPHQEFVRRFMSPYTPYRSLIMYHSLGSGKSIACIAVAVDHYLHDRKKCFIVTKGDSGTDNFARQIELFHEMSSRRDRWDGSLFSMTHYISLSNQIGSMTDDDVVSVFSHCVLVLDEVHNVRYLKKATENSVYGSIIRLLKLCVNVKVIIATATPMTDNPDQINSLLGICNHSRDEPWSTGGIISYNSAVCDKPASTQIGTEMFIPGMPVYASDMVGHQRLAYSREHSVQPPDDIYRKLTHISLFCFGDGTHGRDITESKMRRTRMKTTITSMSTRQTKEIKYMKYDILPEYADALTGAELRNSSSKYSAVIDLIENSAGNVFIFLEEVRGSGLLLLAAILEQHGYELYLGEDVENMYPKRRYTMCVGSSEICPNNSDRLDGFNSDLNRDGEYVRILLGSRVIGESITLRNVRQFYCLTPHWNDSTVDQAIGRVVRNGSHMSLGEDQRHVNIFIHASVYPDDPHNSVDIKKLARCKEKEKNIKKVEHMMVDWAVDKYIYDDSVPVTDVVNFSVAYMHHHEDRVRELMTKCFRTRKSCDIHRLAKALKMDLTVCKEALCRMVLSNVPVGNKKFLRAHGDTVFTVGDPSLPFVMVPDAEYQEADSRPAASPVAPPDDLLPMRDWIHEFRYIPVKRKADFVEKCLAMSRPDLLVDTLFADIDGQFFHLLMYRDLDSSYTRVLDGSVWRNVEDPAVEKQVFKTFKERVGELVRDADEQCPIYGLISTIDGDMRIRLRGMEDHDKSSRDSRYVRRGKSMKSIKKQVLLEVLEIVTGEPVRSGTSINEAASRIDGALVDAGLYILL
jgi:Helicase conserved C-terminal domain